MIITSETIQITEEPQRTVSLNTHNFVSLHLQKQVPELWLSLGGKP